MTNNPETIYRTLIENPKAPQHSRIAALRFLSNPSFALLRRIANNPDTPGRLAALAADLFAQKKARKQLEKQNATHANANGHGSEKAAPSDSIETASSDLLG